MLLSTFSRQSQHLFKVVSMKQQRYSLCQSSGTCSLKCPHRLGLPLHSSQGPAQGTHRLAGLAVPLCSRRRLPSHLCSRGPAAVVSSFLQITCLPFLSMADIEQWGQSFLDEMEKLSAFWWWAGYRIIQFETMASSSHPTDVISPLSWCEAW